MAKANVLTRSKKLKAAQCYQSGRLHEADALYRSICQIDPTDAQAWVARGAIQRELGLSGEAEILCRRAVQLQPGLGAAHQELGAALECQGRRDEALASYRKATQLQPDLAEAHYYLANLLRDAGEFGQAAEHYRTAVRLRPDFVEALSNLGAVLTSMGDLHEAAQLLNKAYMLRPHAPQILCNLGELLNLEKHFEKAREKYEQALALDPNFLDAIVKLADILEKTNRFDEAQAKVERGLALSPDNIALVHVAAALDRRAGRIAEGARRLESCIAGHLGAAELGPLHGLLGQFYDRLGQADQAFFNFRKANALMSEMEKRKAHQLPSYLAYVHKMRSYLVPDLAHCVQDIAGEGKDSNPIFLMGFMRSGTTLLEQILDSHPKLQSIEEKPTVHIMVKAFEDIAQGREQALATLTETELEKLRQVYFREVARYVDLKPGNILVDKMPLNTTHAHIIWRLFPRSKILFAVRHPCDVCLSSYMQNFRVNEATATFLDLEEGAKVYAEVMRLWQDISRTLPLDYHRIRYEDLVADFENRTRALFDFLGLEWRDEVLGYAEHARKRGTVSTASYHQVTQPIYQHAKYRWKRYEKQLAPIIPTLQPFIEYFGYAG